jgi:hypothetical protein
MSPGRTNCGSRPAEANLHFLLLADIIPAYDCDGYSDLWQAGTDQQITSYTWSIFSFDISNYDAWTEFLPRQQWSQVLPNFNNPSRGDEMFSHVWVGNQGAVSVAAE